MYEASYLQRAQGQRWLDSQNWATREYFPTCAPQSGGDEEIGVISVSHRRIAFFCSHCTSKQRNEEIVGPSGKLSALLDLVELA